MSNILPYDSQVLSELHYWFHHGHQYISLYLYRTLFLLFFLFRFLYFLSFLSFLFAYLHWEEKQWKLRIFWLFNVFNVKTFTVQELKRVKSWLHFQEREWLVMNGVWKMTAIKLNLSSMDRFIFFLLVNIVLRFS